MSTTTITAVDENGALVAAVARLHAAGIPCAIVNTGGGCMAIELFLRDPGAFPYCLITVNEECYGEVPESLTSDEMTLWLGDPRLYHVGLYREDADHGAWSDREGLRECSCERLPVVIGEARERVAPEPCMYCGADLPRDIGGISSCPIGCVRTFSTIGYLHNPAINVDRMEVRANRSLDEIPDLTITHASMSGAPAVDVAMNLEHLQALGEAYERSTELADGEAVDAYGVLSAAVAELLNYGARLAQIAR